MDIASRSWPSVPSGTDGNTLHEAAYSGRVEVVQHLLDNGAEVNAVGGLCGNALSAAAYGGHVAVVDLLLRRGAEINSVGGFYGTALQAAAYGDHANVVEILLDRGADIDAEGGEFGSALRAAAHKGHDSVVELLLGRGADPNTQVSNMSAVARDSASLLSRESGSFISGESGSMRSRESGTALHAAARQGHEAVVQLLIDQGADVNAVGGFYGTALQAAASEGHEDVVELLLDNGADVNALSGEFGTALQAAACEGNEEMIILLIERGANVNIRGGEFGSALEAAASEGHDEVVRILLASGADVSSHDQYSNALQLAAYQGHGVIAQRLLDHGAVPSIQGGWLPTTISVPASGETTNLPLGRQATTTVLEHSPREIFTSSIHDVENVSEMREGEQGNGSGKVPSTGINEKGSSNAHATQCSSDPNARRTFSGILQNAWRVIRKFGKFIGPGYIIAVAYMDPGNYSTDILAGATYRFKLLFIILLSNLFAIFLQTLCIKLGTVTGLNLAEHCREHLPRWLNYTLYVLAESAIIATDITEVIGSAIALNLLLNIPLVAGCALTLVDVLIILLFYNTSGSMRKLRYFEYFVILLVLGVMMCFFIQLSYIEGVQVAEVFKGYLPSSSIVEPKGLYLSCGIIGATVMPHSLYVGSGVVQARLHEFDVKEGNIPPEPANFSSSTLSLKYRPSLSAIRNCLNYSVAELVIALFTFALFVNSAILITAGASLSDDDMAKESDLFAVHDLLSKAIAPAAGTIFAVSLLLSGTSAGIVATIAGQMVSEGSLNWTCSPWLRRLITRSISITPSIIIAAAVGRNGLTAALNASQIVLCAILPFVSAPLIYFTCRNKYMTVSTSEGGEVKMRNHWFTATVAVLVWITVAVMDVSLLVLIATGKGCRGGSCHNQFIV